MSNLYNADVTLFRTLLPGVLIIWQRDAPVQRIHSVALHTVHTQFSNRAPSPPRFAAPPPRCSCFAAPPPCSRILLRIPQLTDGHTSCTCGFIWQSKGINQLSVSELIENYVQTAATVLGSAEMARDHIYACGTTTYYAFSRDLSNRPNRPMLTPSFQIATSVDNAKKFEGLPGVVRVAPDHYCNLTTKDYGGDVNIDGTQKINSPEVYNEWIVVVDFPADVSVNEMVQNFYKIASETLGSHEEAANQITKIEIERYRGFHIRMSEDQAKTVSEMPGVAQVLPDSFKPEMLAFQIPKYNHSMITK
ncbi:hypothetical protein ACET3Z_025151 [Daucus carota]